MGENTVWYMPVNLSIFTFETLQWCFWSCTFSGLHFTPYQRQREHVYGHAALIFFEVKTSVKQCLLILIGRFHIGMPHTTHTILHQVFSLVTIQTGTKLCFVVMASITRRYHDYYKTWSQLVQEWSGPRFTEGLRLIASFLNTRLLPLSLRSGINHYD